VTALSPLSLPPRQQLYLDGDRRPPSPCRLGGGRGRARRACPADRVGGGRARRACSASVLAGTWTGLAVGAAACVLGECVRRRGLAAGMLSSGYEESEDMDGWGGEERGGDRDVRSQRRNQETGAKPREGGGRKPPETMTFGSF
jgi:hypothetical protein